MKQSWSWSKIIDGFSGFEKLAVDYVNDIFESNKWVQTQQTRDGNKDAYTIVFGCNLENTDSKCWWMEAKYSEKRKNLTRYRLDSTIVSAILEKNVTRIVFVTNINIKPKVIIDIRNALKNSIHCEEVYFFTKYNLELWLKKTPGKFKYYFPDCDINDLQLPSLVITEQLEIYPQNNNQMIFMEPLCILQREETYYGYFSVYSNASQCVRVVPSKRITLVSNKQILLHHGDNPIQIAFSVNSNYEKEDNLMFFIGKLEIYPCYKISVSNKSKVNIYIESQNSIINAVNDGIKHFKTDGKMSINCVDGLSGCGKSFIVNRLIHENKLAEQDLFYIEFAKSAADNLIQLINLVLFILFPYLPFEEIDLKYIKSIGRQGYISKLILNLIHYKQDYEKICKIIREIHEEEAFFPNHMAINNRYIILDDVQELNLLCVDFLIKLIINLKYKDAPVFFILVGQPLFFESIAYQTLKEHCMVNYFHCQILPDDIHNHLNKKDNFKVCLSNSICENLFPSVIEFVLFIEYMEDRDSDILNINDLILECKLFHNSGVLEQHVIKEFSNFFKYNPLLRNLCDKIYWSLNGCQIEHEKTQNLDGFTCLLDANLIKFNSHGLLVPYHDIYKNYYRTHFERPNTISERKELQSELDYIHETLLVAGNKNVLANTIEIIDALATNSHYYSIMYILQDIYENEKPQILKNRLGYDVYYKLYFYYAIASLHISLNHSDLELFKKLHNDTKNNFESEIIKIHDATTWELINLYYAWLDFDNSQKCILYLYKVMKKEQEMHLLDQNIENCIRYHDLKVMETLLASDQNSINADNSFQINSKKMIDMKFYYRCYSFTVRYAVTIACRNLEHSLLLLETTKEKIKRERDENDRYYLWAEFYIHYFNMIYKSDISLLKTTIFFCNQLHKNYFMDYRKMLLGIATFHFSRQEIEEGNRYLLSDVYVKREYRPRQKAFYFEAIALCEALNNHYEDAVQYLSEADKLFEQLPQFKNIVEHNIKILKENKFAKTKIKYCFCGKLNDSVYYLDPRCSS